MLTYFSRSRAVLAIGLAVLAAASAVGPTSAAVRVADRVVSVVPTYQPDARIRRVGRATLHGNDLYNADGTNQDVVAALEHGNAYVRYVISIQNDGSAPDSFTVRDVTGGRLGFQVSYLRGWPATDVTAAVLDGTFRTPRIQPRGVYRIRLVVYVYASVATPGITNLVTVTSRHDQSSVDAVKYSVSCGNCYE